jgi:hypothetical protein
VLYAQRCEQSACLCELSATDAGAAPGCAWRGERSRERDDTRSASVSTRVLLGVLTPPPNRALECHQLLSPLSFGRKEGGREGEGFTDG